MFVIPTHVGFTHRVVAMLVACALVLWSMGSFTAAQAANLTTISDLLSDSAPASVSDHTITFTPPTGVANGETITVDFSDGPFVVGSVDNTDIDVATTSDYTMAADCTGSEQTGASFSGTTLTITFCSGDGGSIPANGTTTIQIGLNASGGDQQLTNPAVGSYEIVVTAGSSDTGRTRVAIVDTVLVTATVDTVFDFVVSGLGTSTAINGTSTTGSTTATAIPFGTLAQDTVYTLAQQLQVTTNARNGFVVTVEQDGNLQSSTGADIDGFIDGAYTNSPTAWQSPGDSLLNEETWGHWGLTSDDSDLNSDEFDAGGSGDLWVAASTTPRQVFSHTGSADGTTQDYGLAKVGYQVEVTPLQEAADDYQAVLTYIATPTF